MKIGNYFDRQFEFWKFVVNIFYVEKSFVIKSVGELILAYEQFESSVAQQMLQMINEWQNKTNK
jgi:hypothetical protein